MRSTNVKLLGFWTARDKTQNLTTATASDESISAGDIMVKYATLAKT